jgi:hypothetical protein
MGCDGAVEERERDAELLRSLADAMADPFRSRLVTAVTQRPVVSVREIAEWLGETTRKVRYHMEALHSVGLVEVESEVRRRGAIERRYRNTTPNVLYTEDERGLSPGQERRISLEVLKMVMGDATGSVAGGRFGVREGHCETRLRGEVDGQGWDELAELFVRTTEEADRIIGRSTARRKEGEEKGVEVTGALLLFEAPIWNRE